MVFFYSNLNALQQWLEADQDKTIWRFYWGSTKTLTAVKRTFKLVNNVHIWDLLRPLHPWSHGLYSKCAPWWSLWPQCNAGFRASDQTLVYSGEFSFKHHLLSACPPSYIICTWKLSSVLCLYQKFTLEETFCSSMLPSNHMFLRSVVRLRQT